jgi:DnaK suppressor protein
MPLRTRTSATEQGVAPRSTTASHAELATGTTGTNTPAAKKAAPSKSPAKAVAQKAAAAPTKRAPAKAPAKNATKSTPDKSPAKESTPKLTATKAPAKASPATATTAKATPAKAAAAPSATKTAAKTAAPTKAVATKAAPPKKVSAGYVADKPFLEAQRVALNEERATYVEQAANLKAEAESLVEEMEPGDIQFDEESGEGGTVTVDRERDLALSAQALLAVEEIDDALNKIKKGTYGICEGCGELIGKPRLEALPYARLCIACKSGGLSRR